MTQSPIDYQPQYVEEGHWKRLVLCEAEWLARPDTWGFDLLPEAVRDRKETLFYARYLRDMIGILGWDAAHGLTGLLAEDDFVPAGEHMQDLPRIREELGWPRPEGPNQFLRCLQFYARGVFTRVDLLNRLIDVLTDAFHQLYAESDRGQAAIKAYQDRSAQLTSLRRHYAREMIGNNPYRPVGLEAHWMTENVIAIARTIYEDRCFDRLPILADALMDAGCEDDAILSHCRGSGPHFRGCWVIDLILGKG